MEARIEVFSPVELLVLYLYQRNGRANLIMD